MAAERGLTHAAMACPSQRAGRWSLAKVSVKSVGVGNAAADCKFVIGLTCQLSADQDQGVCLLLGSPCGTLEVG